MTGNTKTIAWAAVVVLAASISYVALTSMHGCQATRVEGHRDAALAGLWTTEEASGVRLSLDLGGMLQFDDGAGTHLVGRWKVDNGAITGDILSRMGADSERYGTQFRWRIVESRPDILSLEMETGSKSFHRYQGPPSGS